MFFYYAIPQHVLHLPLCCSKQNHTGTGVAVMFCVMDAADFDYVFAQACNVSRTSGNKHINRQEYELNIQLSKHPKQQEFWLHPSGMATSDVWQQHLLTGMHSTGSTNLHDQCSIHRSADNMLLPLNGFKNVELSLFAVQVRYSAWYVRNNVTCRYSCCNNSRTADHHSFPLCDTSF